MQPQVQLPPPSESVWQAPSQNIAAYPELAPFQTKQDTDTYMQVVETEVVKRGILPHMLFRIKGVDRDGNRDIKRRYHQFFVLRQRLVLAWPGCFIPPLPPKSVRDKTHETTVKIRIRLLNEFLRRIAQLPQIFYGEQFRTFLKADEGTVEAALEGVKAPNSIELLQKYSKEFPDFRKYSLQEEIVKELALKIKQAEAKFRQKKTLLNDRKNTLRKAAQTRQQLQGALRGLRLSVLPQYERLMLPFYKGKNASTLDPSLFSTPTYQTSILSLNPFCSSLWRLYDVLKYEGREIDAVLQAIDQCKGFQTEYYYLQRTIANNQAQIQALNGNKSTLKTFLMGGTVDDKKTKLAQESEQANTKLRKKGVIIQERLKLFSELGSN